MDKICRPAILFWNLVKLYIRRVTSMVLLNIWL